MALTQIRGNQITSQNITPDLISTNPTDDFTLPHDLIIDNDGKIRVPFNESSPTYTFTQDGGTGMGMSDIPSPEVTFWANGTESFRAVETGLKVITGRVEVPEMTDAETATPTFTATGSIDTGMAIVTDPSQEVDFFSNGTKLVRISLDNGGLLIVDPDEVGTIGIKNQDGIDSDPSYTFLSDSTTGMYLSSSGVLALSTSGTQALQINSDQNIGIGGAPVDNGILTLTSTTKAFVPPRMDTTQRDAITPLTAGMTIFNTDDNELNVYNGTIWVPVGSTAFPLLAPDGSESAPSYAFEDQPNTGLFRTGLFLSVTSNATEVVRFGDSGIEVQPDMPLKNSTGSELSPSYTFVDDETAGLFLDTNDLVFVTNSTSALSIGTDQSIDFLQHEAKNLVVHLLASNPVSPVEGQIWYNTTTKQWVGYNGTINVVLG